MTVWITSYAAARRHGVYAISRTPPKMLRPAGTGVVAMVGQFPWGPDTASTTPTGTKQMIDMFAPPGMSHTATGYLALLGKAYPTLRIVRPVGGAAAAAVAALTSAGPITQINVTMKYKGAAGNSITCTVADASDGIGTHCNVTVSVTGASGTTSELYANVDNTAVTFVAPTVTSSLLVASFARNGANVLRPANGTYTAATGSDGAITATEYVGTPGAGNLGLALLEGDKSIRHVFVDDCGTGIRAAVNAGVVAHAILCGDRIGYINGDSALTAAQTVTNVGTYTRSERVVYCAPWAYIYDDITGAERLVSPSPFGASVCSQVSPSTSPAWKDGETGAMLAAIIRLETDYGASIPDLTDAGIMTLERETDGSFRFEAGVNTYAVTDPSKKNITRTRIGDYIAISFVDSVRTMVDAPNVDVNQISLVGALEDLLDTLVANQFKDPNHYPYIKAYTIDPLASVNSTATLAQGDFTIPVEVQCGSNMERIFLSIMFGESVTVTVS